MENENEEVEVELTVEDEPKPKPVKEKKIYKVFPYKCIKCGKKTTSSNQYISKEGKCKPCKEFEKIQSGV
jgi:hypothetical protein